MIPLSLYLSGFLSYRDPVELDLTQLDLACIAGPNGAGKSSLLDAFTWSLFGVARKRDYSLINAQSHTARVILIFAYENNIYQVMRIKQREKTTTLEFHILQDHPVVGSVMCADLKLEELTGQKWKPLTERSLRETEARIVDTLRMDYDTFVNASFFLQGKADQFTQQRPGDRKRILSSILGLEIWEQYRQRALESRRQLEAEMDILDGRLQEILAELSEEASRVQRLADLNTQLESLTSQRVSQQGVLDTMRQTQAVLKEQQRLVENQGRQVQAGETRYAGLQTRFSARQKEQDTYMDLVEKATEIRENYALYKDLQKQLAEMDQIAIQFRQQEKQREAPRLEIQAEQARLEQERKTLEDRQKQVLLVEAELEKLETQSRKIAAELAGVEAQLMDRDKRMQELDAAKQKRQEFIVTNQQLKQEMKLIKERLGKLESVSGAECPLCGQKVNQSEQKRLIASLSLQGTNFGDQYRENQRQIQDFEEHIQELGNLLLALRKAEEEARRLSQDEARVNTRLESLRAALQEWETVSEPRLVDIAARLLKEDYAQKARAKLAEVDKQLQQIGYDVARHDDLRQQVSERQALEEKYQKLENAQAVLTQVQRELVDLQNQLDQENEALENLRQEHQQASKVLASLQENAPDLERAEDQLRALQEQENRVLIEVGAARQRVNILEDQRERRKTYELQREKYALKVRQYKQLERAFGKDGVPALLIEQALPEIENKANEILSRLSDGAMSVRFVTQAAYKNKKREDLRETLEIQISDGNGQRDYEMFSGGEAFRVNFAVRLALSETLAKRAGARLQTLVIDEGFGSQDALGRQRLVEAINLVKQDFAKVLVITHIDELKDFFPNRIEVDKTNRGSTVQVL
jgi:exonuclease SbcC